MRICSRTMNFWAMTEGFLCSIQYTAPLAAPECGFAKAQHFSGAAFLHGGLNMTGFCSTDAGTSVSGAGGVSLQEVAAFIAEYLRIPEFPDPSYNGLQVEGERSRVSRIVTGVTANVALFEEARSRGADLVMTHHGLFWKGGDPRITGVLARRVRTLSGMSLIACHLPLDAHPEIGNNVLLVKMLGAKNLGYLTGRPQGITVLAEFDTSAHPEALRRLISQELGREPLVMGPADRPVRKIAVCSGGGGFVLEEALPPDLDALLTGEVHEQHFHLARELGITVFAAGHHATEKCGIRALGDVVASRFGITAEFVDIPSPL